MSEAAINAFLMNFRQLAAGETGLVPEADIKPVETLPRFEALPDVDEHKMGVGP